MLRENMVVHIDECKCLMWRPIVAGALTAIGLSFLLHLFTVAIGLTAFTTDNTGTETLVLGGYIATALGLVAAMFASGWIAGYLGNRYCTKRHLGALYGFLTWCLALLVGMFLEQYSTQYVTYYTHTVSGITTVDNAANTLTHAVATAPSHSVVLSAYIVFVLFFLSAFSASFGGHCGMRHLDKQ